MNTEQINLLKESLVEMAIENQKLKSELKTVKGEATRNFEWYQEEKKKNETLKTE